MKRGHWQERWIERHGKPCKIGTIPMVVQVHGADWNRLPAMVGKEIRVRYSEGGRWERVRVNRVDATGYFQADR